MSKFSPRRAWGRHDGLRDFSAAPAAIYSRLRPIAFRIKARFTRLANSPAERALLADQVRQGLRQALPWPPVVEVLLVLLWLWELHWGESSAFSSAISKCSWSSWETWPADATPYRIAMIADPQLVDPHTYPGRPWPLSTLTIKHTDQYLRRSFDTILNTLHPSSVLFLGDLFDGGREWSTLTSQSPEKRYRKYGDDYWLREYARFGRIFVDPWIQETASHGGKERRFAANMPGNHDLGIANGVQLPVRARFSLYFGDGNDIQVLGNHSIVTIDSVSLSAKGEQGDNHAIWGPTDTFLNNAKNKKKEVIERELRTRLKERENRLMEHSAIDADHFQGSSTPLPEDGESTDLPTILLTHVPLYREPGTPCGPFREKYPPTKSSGSEEALASDDANSIKVQAGYQYQNVLHPDISKDLIEKIGGVEHVFSGDDHDYCEILHRQFTSRGGGIREITVKSLSWAMGVRHPGFVLVSLWNPLAKTAGQSTRHTSDTTIQTQLCLLPDQLGIFLSYLKLLIFTALVLVLNAAYLTMRGWNELPHPVNVLPVDERDAHSTPYLDGSHESTSSSSSAHSSDSMASTNLRANGARPRGSPTAFTANGYNFLRAEKPGYGYAFESENTAAMRFGRGAPTRPRMRFLMSLWKSLRLVGLLGFGWYLLLMKTV